MRGRGACWKSNGIYAMEGLRRIRHSACTIEIIVKPHSCNQILMVIVMRPCSKLQVSRR